MRPLLTECLCVTRSGQLVILEMLSEKYSETAFNRMSMLQGLVNMLYWKR